MSNLVRNWLQIQGLLLNVFTDIHQGVGWLGVGERYHFSLQKIIRTTDPCPGTNFSQHEGIFFGGKLKGNVRRIVDEMVHRKAQRQFSQISGWISVGRKNNCLESYVLCPRRLRLNKGEKYNHSRPLNYQNIIKSIIKFTCTNSKNVSAKKDFVETFTLQKINTLSKEFVALCSKEFVTLCVPLCGLEGWCPWTKELVAPKPKSWFVRQKVLGPNIHKTEGLLETKYRSPPCTMAGRCRELQLICSIGHTQKKQDAARTQAHMHACTHTPMHTHTHTHTHTWPAHYHTQQHKFFTVYKQQKIWHTHTLTNGVVLDLTLSASVKVAVKTSPSTIPLQCVSPVSRAFSLVAFEDITCDIIEPRVRTTWLFRISTLVLLRVHASTQAAAGTCTHLQVTALEFCSVRKLRTFWTVRKLSALPHGQLACTLVSKDASNSSPRS